MNDETIKKFKSDIENIEIPERDLQKAVYTAIRRGSSEKSSFRKIRYISSVAVILFALILGSGFVSPTMANVLSHVPYLKSVLPFTDQGLKVVNEKGLIQPVGQTVIDQGIPLTITDVYYDHSRLEIGYVIPLENVELGDLRDIQILGISKVKVFLDGEEIGYSASADYKEDYIIGTISDTHTDLSQFSETSKLKIEITEVLNRQGNWLFEFDNTRIGQKTTVIMNQSIESDQYKLSINEIEFTPSSTKIEYIFDVSSDIPDFNAHSFSFNLYEGQKKLELIKTGIIEYKHTENGNQLISELYFEPLDEKNKKLSLVPLINKGKKEEVLSNLKMNISIHE